MNGSLIQQLPTGKLWAGSPEWLNCEPGRCLKLYWLSPRKTSCVEYIFTLRTHNGPVRTSESPSSLTLLHFRKHDSISTQASTIAVRGMRQFSGHLFWIHICYIWPGFYFTQLQVVCSYISPQPILVSALATSLPICGLVWIWAYSDTVFGGF